MHCTADIDLSYRLGRYIGMIDFVNKFHLWWHEWVFYLDIMNLGLPARMLSDQVDK